MPIGNVFEEWPGDVRRPWNGTPLLLLSTLTTADDQSTSQFGTFQMAVSLQRVMLALHVTYVQPPYFALGHYASLLTHTTGDWKPKAKIHCTSFSRSKPITSWRVPRNKSSTSPQPPQHKRRVRNKSVTSWRCVCCVVTFPEFHYNDLLPTSPHQVTGKRV